MDPCTQNHFLIKKKLNVDWGVKYTNRCMPKYVNQ